MKITATLEAAVKKACDHLYGSQPDTVQVQLTSKDFDGQWTVVVFPLLRMSKTSPEKTGEAIGNYLLEECAEVSGFNVVKGFLNLVIADNYWVEVVNEALKHDNYGAATPDSKPLVLVEFSSPNTNKPLHLGHLRNIFLGFSLSEIMKAAGHETKKVQIINDRGIHICKSMVAWKKFGNGETPEISGMKGDKLVGKYYVIFDQQHKAQIAELVSEGMDAEEAAKQTPILKEAQEMLLKWEQDDPEVRELWNTMNNWVYAGFDATYHEMGVDFDQLYYESETFSFGREEVMRGLNEGVFFKKDDGSIWVDLTEDGMDQKLLLRADGTAVYITQDIGTAILRYRDYPEMSKMVYTVGNEQEYHFKVLFLVLQKLGYEWASNCHHLSYGMVELPEGKMKSREGTVIDADDLMAEMKETARDKAEELGKLEDLSNEEAEDLFRKIGQAALKFYLLKVDARKNMLFDPKESIDFNGHTGPFIQYTHARIQSLLRKAGDDTTSDTNIGIALNDTERQLALKVDRYPEVICEAAEKYSPAELANFLYELVKDYNSFYQVTPVLKEEDADLRSFRLELTRSVGRVVASGLGLLGISAPDRM